MSELSLCSTVSAVKDQVSCDLAGEAVILSLKNGIYYTLNPMGARIWALVQAPVPASAVRDTILAEYDVDAGRCEAELLSLLEDLHREGLIEVENPNF